MFKGTQRVKNKLLKKEHPGKLITFLVETFSTELADERLVPGVDPYVSI